MNYCIISDVHNRTYLAEQIASKYEATRTIIFLGDYFDQFHDSRYDAEKTAKWLKHSIQQPNRIHLLGNHDAAYVYPFHKALVCPGYTSEKNRAIRAVLSQAELESLKLYYYIEEGNWMLSHAGFTYANLFGFKHALLAKPGAKYDHVKDFTKEELLSYLKKEEKDFCGACRNNKWHHFMFQGTRMGNDGNGGPFWLHLSDFYPMKQWNQICGHTTIREPAACYIPNKKNPVSTNWFIDTYNQHIAFIENGVFLFDKTSNIL